MRGGSVAKPHATTPFTTKMLISFDPSHELAPVPSGVSVDKVAKNKWPHPGEKGEFRWIDKRLLCVDDTYQRGNKNKKIASEFNWQSCGAISVMEREDGILAVVDGQHRAIAAWMRSDITEMPCMVFRSQGVAHEADAFVKINTNRKAVAAFDKYKANLVAGDKTAKLIDYIAKDYGLSIRPDGETFGVITCVAACERLIKRGEAHYAAVLDVAAVLAQADNVNVSQILLGGLSVLHCKVAGGLDNERLVEKLKQVGAKALVERARQMTYRLGKGGENTWAQGMLEIVNQITRGKKFVMSNEAQP